MVSPSTSPEKPSKPKFPLFNRLLHESLSGRVPARNGNYPECPATAPVLLCSSKTSIDDMAKETVHKEKNLNTKEDDNLEEYPIKLLYPPKQS
ncbi:uncharacterized protein LOC132739690 isoform X2 [Ruditapes philippinarum]|uniref:uncharacterized protein LOC132739690 isoform X2 n=1 Tax=Ruditapes philippinarum TaxID=129788 RepID=UPI00295B4036|nr:uncharacterized protein LOC132739690 isoform X2 [Ruditapes philippinarum]